MALIRKHYRKVPEENKNTEQPSCTLTTPATHGRCRWRAAAAASHKALDQKHSPGGREVAEHRSQRTYTRGRRRRRSESRHLLAPDLELLAPPSTATSKGKSPTAPPQRHEHDEGGGSTAELQGTPSPEGRTTTCKHRPPRHRLPDAGSREPKHSYTIYTTRIGDPPTSRRRSGRRRPRNPPNRRRRGGAPGRTQKSPSFTVDGEGWVQGPFFNDGYLES
jgi:hypothetical protein